MKLCFIAFALFSAFDLGAQMAPVEELKVIYDGMPFRASGPWPFAISI